MQLMDRIPIELWGVIAGFLHSRDQCALLFLSRTLRRAAQGHLFRQLDLYFGLWERIKPSDYSDTSEEDTVGTADSREEMLDKNSRRTTEILARIDQDDTFAHGIRSLRVMCYTNSGLTNKGERAETCYDMYFIIHISETELLINGIKAMPQLKRFEWLGIFPPLTHQTALGMLPLEQFFCVLKNLQPSVERVLNCMTFGYLLLNLHTRLHVLFNSHSSDPSS
jgi:hypothetical protein